jgi:hypothetical protein
LTGSQAFAGDSFNEPVTSHFLAPPPRPSAFGVPVAFDDVIARGMAKDPGERYPTALDLARAARQALTSPVRDAEHSYELASMSITPSGDARTPPRLADDARVPGSQPLAEPDEREFSGSMSGGNAVGVLTALAFVAFLVSYAVAGPWAAGLAFWSVVFGLPALLVVVSALGAAWRRSRRDELLAIAMLAVRLSEQRRAAGGVKAAASVSADFASGPVDRDLAE